jgi:hypothetical protein
VTSISEPTTTYVSTTAISESEFNAMSIGVYPNPASDFIAVQAGSLVEEQLTVQLLDMAGRLVKETYINPGSTIAWIDTRTIYDGQYIIKVSSGTFSKTSKVIISR